MRSKILLAFGTRPELIKLAPVIEEFKKRGLRSELFVLNLGQHSSLMARDLHDFGITPDETLQLNRDGRDLSKLCSQILQALQNFQDLVDQRSISFKLIIVQGDTASAYCVAQHAFFIKVPIYHVEAGLRTESIDTPFPEEFFRRSISMVASFHFAPTQIEADHLIKGGVDNEKVVITGNTVVDMLANNYMCGSSRKDKRLLITLHRRGLTKEEESQMRNHILTLASNNPSWKLKWITHPGSKLSKSLPEQENLEFEQPLPYRQMLKEYERTSLILTDSGGVQEEAAYLGIPCIVASKETSRVAGIQHGCSQKMDLHNVNLDGIIESFQADVLQTASNLYGNGSASRMIVDTVQGCGQVVSSITMES